MATATIRDLRTKFPKLKAQIARDGEIVVTDRGRPAYVLRAYTPPARVTPQRIDYYARLSTSQPCPLSSRAARALDEADRGER